MKKLILAIALVSSFSASANWSTKSKVDDFTGDIDYTASEPSNQAAMGCSKGGVAIVLGYDKYVSNGAKTKIQWVVDNEVRGTTTAWGNQRSAYWFDPSTEAIEAMKKGSTMKTRIRTYNNSTNNEFSLSGFTKAYSWLAEKCKE